MQFKPLVFDIETIPIVNPSKIQLEIIEEKTNKWMEYEEDKTSENREKVKNKIMGTSPFFGEIVCIGAFNPNDNEKISFKSTKNMNECALLTSFWNYIKSSNFTRYVSFNGLSFDVPFIHIRSIANNVSNIVNNFLITPRYRTTPHYDVMQVLCDWDSRRAVSLRLACDLFGIPSPKEDLITAENVAKYFHLGNIDGIAEYCLKDVIATYEIYELLIQTKP